MELVGHKDFISASDVSYDPSTGRRMINLAARGVLEIENSFRSTENLNDALTQSVMLRRGTLIQCLTSSCYFDTSDLAVLNAGYTSRARLGGDYKAIGDPSTVHERYPNQYSVKWLYVEFQTVAREIASGLFPKQDELVIFYPVIRSEVEGEHEWPENSSVLHYADLPNDPFEGHDQSIASLFKSAIADQRINGMTTTDDLKLHPLVSTIVGRKLVKFYLEPDIEYDFDKTWPSLVLTDEMKAHGKYLCIEVAIDKCDMWACPKEKPIDLIMRSQDPRKELFKYLETKYLIEYELKGKYCGKKLTDGEMVKGWVHFGRGLSQFAHNHPDRRRNSHMDAAGRIRNAGHDRPFFQPTRSKGVTALGVYAVKYGPKRARRSLKQVKAIKRAP